MAQVRCRCGHSIPDHLRSCGHPGCDCQRDRFHALESGLDAAAEERLNGPQQQGGPTALLAGSAAAMR